ncbi:MAG: hypothetical protein WDZ80_06125 [Candidatus Paceibacterota bacterium]
MISLALILTSVLFVYLNLDNVSYPLILNFSSYEGVNLMGEASDLWNVISIAVAISIINIILSYLFFFRERLISYVILGTNVIILTLLFIGVSHIISIN